MGRRLPVRQQLSQAWSLGSEDKKLIGGQGLWGQLLGSLGFRV